MKKDVIKKLNKQIDQDIIFELGLHKRLEKTTSAEWKIAFEF